MSDPRQAWTGTASTQLPGPWAYWGTTITMAVLVVIAIEMVMSWRHGRNRGVDQRVRFGVSTQARQARTADLSSLVVRRPESGRLLFARHRRKLLATETNRMPATSRRERRALRRRGDRGAVIHVGPSRCGKTTTVIAGALEWRGPAILSSVKSDLLDATLAARAEMGEVRIFDPTGSCGRGTARWSPLRDSAHPAGAQRAAAALISATPKDGVSDAGFWHIQAEAYLTGLLLTAALNGRTMSDVATWVLKGDQPTDGNPGQIGPLIRVADGWWSAVGSRR